MDFITDNIYNSLEENNSSNKQNKFKYVNDLFSFHKKFQIGL